jgi:hypothetical protein
MKARPKTNPIWQPAASGEKASLAMPISQLYQQNRFKTSPSAEPPHLFNHSSNIVPPLLTDIYKNTL